MRECLYYWLVEPVRTTFRDEAGSIPALEVPIEAGIGAVSFAVFVDEHGLPICARLHFPCGDEDRIPEDVLPLIQAVREHFLSALRLEFSADAHLFPRAIWQFIDSGSEYSFGLNISATAPLLTLDPEAFRRTFQGCFQWREEVRLLLDGADTGIPLQYRFLSLYRLLELLLKPHRHWQREDLVGAFAPYAESIREAGFLRSPVNTLHELRDACAHIRHGAELGVTHLNLAQAARVEKFLPILLDVIIDLLNIRCGPSLTFGRGAKPQPEPTGS